MIMQTVKLFLSKHTKMFVLVGIVGALGTLGYSHYKVYKFGQDSILAKQTEMINEYEQRLAERQKALDERKSERVQALEERVREIRGSTDRCANSSIPDDILRNLD